MGYLDCKVICVFFVLCALWGTESLANDQVDDLMNQVSLFNTGDDMSFVNFVTLENGTSVYDPPSRITLSKGVVWNYAVLPEAFEILSMPQKTNATGCYSQQVFLWSNRQLSPPWVACAPICAWAIDNIGFFLTDLQGNPVEFVISWSGPNPCPPGMNVGNRGYLNN